MVSDLLATTEINETLQLQIGKCDIRNETVSVVLSTQIKKNSEDIYYDIGIP